MYHCQLCFDGLTIDKVKKNLVCINNSESFQCPKCFYIHEPIKIINYEDVCPICLENPHGIFIHDKCHHFVCKYCSKSNPNRYKCVICRTKSHITFFYKPKYNEYDYFDKFSSDLKNCFKELYIKINSTIGKYMNVDADCNVLHILLKEYHKWLQLLNLNCNNYNENKLWASQIIDRIWKEHMKLSANYITCCDIICGYTLKYYPFETYDKEKITKLYEEHFGPIEKSYQLWKPLTLGNEIIINASHIVKCKFYGGIYKIPVNENTTGNDLIELVLSVAINYDPLIRINFFEAKYAGRKIFATEKLLEFQYPIVNGSTVQVIY